MLLRARTFVSSDAALAVALAAAATAEIRVRAPGPKLLGWVVLCVVVSALALWWRRRAPLVAATSFGAVVFSVSVGLGGTRFGDALPVAVVIGLFIMAYSLGAHLQGPSVAIGLLALALGLFSFSHSLAVLVIGSCTPWIAGWAIRSQRQLTEQLGVHARQLYEQREMFARESVRYERARIARELHDVVAHSLSLIVVQAAAGHRLAERDPSSAATCLDHVAEAAVQAQEEIGRLFELLTPADRPVGDIGVLLIEQLVARAAKTRLPVRCAFAGPHENLTGAGAEAAYRLVQESITNALKHAPGAEIDITVRGTPTHVDIEVINGPPRSRTSGIERSGGGHGINGMRERVESVGGQLDCGGTGGGWRVSARIPCAGSAAPSGSLPSSS